MRIILIALLFFAATPAFAKPWCKEDHTIGTECWVEIQDLHPLQPAVGLEDVQKKQVKVRHLYKKSEKKYLKYLKKNPIQIVIGPGGALYIVDGHHLAKALYNEDFRFAQAKVLGNYRGKSEAEFLEILQKKDPPWVRLINENGKAVGSLSDLPKHVRGLKSDRYRSLAWYLREAGVFRKTEYKFAEFIWGDCFRQHGIKIGPGKTGMEKAIKEALDLVKEKKCGPGLPGYIERMKKSPTFEACMANYVKLRTGK